ncbi:hypothetical protein AMTRI_Chr12g275470 [Amborella trichopoda]|uniref:CST complex subunit STN1 n=1 Tax=Amborella trichopoda TaxID=13333 RepID=W1PK50_AMBTC|nr:CST complex subunit STN1 [Amborella trichopoda]ERN07485.1 hypothetical protein AMTR_s00019p00256500 [Amborella trichopoda]|eukprot:XP_006845810.1 CST complex subunit STN1 [Amborella trichopoda]
MDRYVHVKLLNSFIVSLSKTPDYRFALSNGKRVSLVETVGVVVGRERKDKFLRFHLDDGSALLPCILWLNHLYLSPSPSPRDELLFTMAVEQAEEVALGKLMTVRGRITEYRGVKQITVSNLRVEENPNAEILHWLQCIKLGKESYNLRPPLTSNS